MTAGVRIESQTAMPEECGDDPGSCRIRSAGRTQVLCVPDTDGPLRRDERRLCPGVRTVAAGAHDGAVSELPTEGLLVEIDCIAYIA
jgi:hypothetical protein